MKPFIEAKKNKYYSRISKKMINPLTSAKTSLLILKSISIIKKIPCISTLLRQNRYINKHEEKTEIFNNFFANQCSLIDNSNVFPSLLFERSETVIFFINFSLDDIAKVIQKLDPNKGHGHDVISI